MLGSDSVGFKCEPGSDLASVYMEKALKMVSGTQ